MPSAWGSAGGGGGGGLRELWQQAGGYAHAVVRLKGSYVFVDRRQPTPTSHFRGHGGYLRKLKLGVKKVTEAIHCSRLILRSP